MGEKRTEFHTVDDAVNDALRAAIVPLVREQKAAVDHAGPVYFMLPGVRIEERARELAVAFHAALDGSQLMAKASRWNTVSSRDWWVLRPDRCD
ncbi:hypothetical protein ACFYZJ_28130 [Streptomyces sp. NPDC001848]|uniref:hypothetical protein n=1 Tax=Streptomyces sp. NPDC001848 TaxID=3364618 RepID=UPI003674302C